MKAISAGGIINRFFDGELKTLLVERSDGTFFFPKGHIEIGETAQLAAKREIMEEVGLDVEIGDLLGLIKRKAPDGLQIIKEIYIYATLVSNFKHQQAEESYHWFTFDEAAGLMKFPEEKEFVIEYRKNLPYSNIKQIQEALFSMYEADQRMRVQQRLTNEYDQQLDTYHIQLAKNLIKLFGKWPSISEIGKDSARHLWILIQHADIDPSFQAKCLQLMKDLPKEEVNLQDVAFLEDRVKVNRGEPQVYGTQFYEDEKGNYGPRPMEDIDGLEDRRASMGLGSFTEYEQNLRDLKSKKAFKPFKSL